MKLRENIAVSESGFLFDPNSGESFSVNASGKEILRLLAKGKSLAEIETTILSDYNIDEKSFNRYMDDFLHTLRRFNLIEAATDE
ncbi:MAG: HPr-rel-A system PqqD family peptide chaperone [Bacteroidales bacterium]|nr:HPr-rel-A system PqqD family peptide chaperone [Bacteroidales bacterium]MDT8431602.1 HPr-rel-A system PqqD family peptide chaperone [Bacteroidales bacterium]